MAGRKIKTAYKEKSYEVSSVIEYLVTGLAIILLGMFFDANVAVTFFSVYILIPVVSILGVFLVERNLSLSIASEESIIEKGAKGTLIIHVKNNSIVPVLNLSVSLKEEYRVRYEKNQSYNLTMGGKSEMHFEGAYTAMIWGSGEIGVSEIVISDIFRFLSCRICYVGKNSKLTAKIKIVPNIPKLRSGNDFFQLDHYSVDDENDEKNSVMQQNTFNQTPGFQYRKYEPGDSFKMINWKVSEKAGEYMVRLFEPIQSKKCSVYLYNLIESGCDSVSSVWDEQLLVEGGLSILQELLNRKINCRVFCRIDGIQQEMEILNESDLAVFQAKLTDFQFEYKETDFADSLNLDKIDGAIILLALKLRGDLESKVEKAKQQGKNIVPVIVTETDENGSALYKITEAYELLKLG